MSGAHLYPIKSTNNTFKRAQFFEVVDRIWQGSIRHQLELLGSAQTSIIFQH